MPRPLLRTHFRTHFRAHFRAHLEESPQAHVTAAKQHTHTALRLWQVPMALVMAGSLLHFTNRIIRIWALNAFQLDFPAAARR